MVCVKGGSIEKQSFHQRAESKQLWYPSLQAGICDDRL